MLSSICTIDQVVMDYIQSYFSNVGFRGDELSNILEAFELRTFGKNDLFVTEGKVSRQIGIVGSGIFQYYANKDGVEITSYVSVPNTWIASVRSFVSETPSLENIRALTSGELYLISKSALKRLVGEVPGFKDFYINLLEQSISGIDESRHDLIVLTADQRYAKLLQNEPHLLQQIPLQHLASMLGITPRHLSRIRATIR